MNIKPKTILNRKTFIVFILLSVGSPTSTSIRDKTN